MHFKITLNLTRSSLRELEEIHRQMTLAIVRFETRRHCLESKLWSLTFIDRVNDELFESLGENDRVIWISERVETVPPKVIVSVIEDVFDRTRETLEQIFKQ